MEGTTHIQDLTDKQNKFVKQLQTTMDIEKNVRPNKSQAVAKIIDYAIKNNVELKEIIK